MESADDKVRRAARKLFAAAKDVYYSAVRTAGDEDKSALFFYHQALLVAEVVPAQAVRAEQYGVGLRDQLPARPRPEKTQAREELEVPVQPDEPAARQKLL